MSPKWLAFLELFPWALRRKNRGRQIWMKLWKQAEDCFVVKFYSILSEKQYVNHFVSLQIMFWISLFTSSSLSLIDYLLLNLRLTEIHEWLWHTTTHLPIITDMFDPNQQVLTRSEVRWLKFKTVKEIHCLILRNVSCLSTPALSVSHLCLSLSLCRIGTAGIAVQVVGSNWPKPHYTLLITGLCRFSVSSLLKERPFVLAEVKLI